MFGVYTADAIVGYPQKHPNMQANGQSSFSANCSRFSSGRHYRLALRDFIWTPSVRGLTEMRPYPCGIIQTAPSRMVAEMHFRMCKKEETLKEKS
jgi:hypothetical protein